MSTVFFRRQWIVPYLFLAPALIGTIAFKLYPIFLGFWESLIYTSFGGGIEKRTFVWFENYQYLFDAGAVAVFGPGTKISDAAIQILEILIDSVE